MDTVLSIKVKANQDHKEFMLKKDHRLTPKCVISLSNISFEKEIERQWAMSLEKECLTQFISQNTDRRTMNKTLCH